MGTLPQKAAAPPGDSHPWFTALPVVGWDDVRVETGRTTTCGDGYAVLATGFPADLADALVADAGRYEFRHWSSGRGGAFAMAALDAAGATGAATAWLARAAATHGLAGFAPNEVSYQRYTAGGKGLRPHRDQRYYGTCIAIVTLRGSATFAVHAGLDPADVVAEWTTGPGQVILLRGWRPGPGADPRPYHRIDAPVSGERLMFQARHNIAAAPRSPWAEHLTEAEITQGAELAAMVPFPRAAER